MVSAKRQRTNTKNIPKEAWDYIDYETKRLTRLNYVWEVQWYGKLVNRKQVARGTKTAVEAWKQSERTHGTFSMLIKQVSSLTRYCRKGNDMDPAPVKPLNCVVSILGTCSDANVVPSGSATGSGSLNAAFAQRDNSRSTVECGLDSDQEHDWDVQAPVSSRLSGSGSLHWSSKNMLHRNLQGSLEELRKPTVSSTVQGDRTTTFPDFAEHQQNDGHSSAGTHAEFLSRDKSPEMIAVTSPPIPVPRKTAAAPATSAVSVTSHMSHLSQYSWKNFPLGSQERYVGMKSPAQSIPRSSSTSKAHQDLLSMSHRMESLKV